MAHQPCAFLPRSQVVNIKRKSIADDADRCLGAFLLFVFGEAVADDGLHETVDRKVVAGYFDEGVAPEGFFDFAELPAMRECGGQGFRQILCPLFYGIKRNIIGCQECAQVQQLYGFGRVLFYLREGHRPCRRDCMRIVDRRIGFVEKFCTVFLVHFKIVRKRFSRGLDICPRLLQCQRQIAERLRKFGGSFLIILACPLEEEIYSLGRLHHFHRQFAGPNAAPVWIARCNDDVAGASLRQISLDVFGGGHVVEHEQPAGIVTQPLPHGLAYGFLLASILFGKI